MDYAVYIYGGGKILWTIFNGISLIFASDNPYFTSVGTLTIGIALLYTAVRSVPGGSLPIFFKEWILPTFLLVALFYGPKASVNIIDKVDLNFKYSKVDNIPLGIAAVASLSSTLAEFLTEHIETIFTSSDMERFSRVGPMFGAKLIQAAHTLSIRDPLIRENLKDFTRQCFAWPYVFSNLEPGKKAALETEDMLGFIEANPHPLLGIYWRQPNGQSAFMNCRECATRVREIIPIEVETGFRSLAMKMFDIKGDGEAETRRLKQYFGDAWQYLARGSSDAAHIIQQELMLNSYRGALQDKRDELGLGRNSSELAHLNADRGIAQQDSSFLVKAALSGSQIPILHTIIFTLALIYFAIMAPMTFLPGGIGLLVTWVKVMAWLATWPILLAILNALGHMFAAQSTASQMMGYGQGLNLMTQNGLADAAYNAYCFVMGLQYSVPFISYALLWSGGYAFSQLSSSFTQSGEAFAGKAGAEVVDGNVSFDAQNLHTRSIANSQIAQQQLGSSFNYGSRFDDGKIAALYGTEGQLSLQEHQTQLGTNVSQNDAVSAMSGLQSQVALQSSLNHTKAAGQQVQMGMNELFSLTKSLADSQEFTETFGESGSASAQKSLSNSMDIAKQFAKDHNISEDKAFNILLGASAEMGGGAGGQNSGFFGKLAASLGGQLQASARDSEGISESIKSGQAKQFADNLSHGLQYVEDNKGSTSNTLSSQKLDQAQQHFNKAENFSEQATASLQESQMWSETASLQRQKGIASGSNLNDSSLAFVADKRFGGDRVAAAAWQTQNPSAYQKDIEGFLDKSQTSMQPSNLSSRADVSQHNTDLRQNIKSTPTNNPGLEDVRQKHNLNQGGYELEATLQARRQETRQTIDQHKVPLNNEEFRGELDAPDQAFEGEKSKGLIMKSWNKIRK
jgi:conjugal transfer mating pair stabilization protein TraG